MGSPGSSGSAAAPPVPSLRITAQPFVLPQRAQQQTDAEEGHAAEAGEAVPPPPPLPLPLPPAEPQPPEHEQAAAAAEPVPELEAAGAAAQQAPSSDAAAAATKRVPSPRATAQPFVPPKLRQP